MKVFEYTNKGGREINQDYLAHCDVSDGISLYVVADGMGGYENGEIAAKIVGDSVCEFVPSHFSEYTVEEILRKSFSYANSCLMVKRMAMNVPEMGCVVVAALVAEGKVSVAWLGDSRAYHIRNGKTQFVTTDHSMINELKAAGTFKESDRELYEACVTRCIMGDNSSYTAGFASVDSLPGDALVLCSDGIHKEMDVESLPSDDSLLRKQLDNLAPALGDNLSIIRITL